MYIIPKEEFIQLKKIKEQELTMEEGEVIIEHQKTFIKYLLKIMTDIQLSLGIGKYKGKEQEAYSRIDAITQIIKWITEIEKAMVEFHTRKSWQA